MDSSDQKILTHLQRDSTTPLDELASLAGLSRAACWRRIKRLEDDGIIKRKVALLDHKKMNVGVTVFMTVRSPRHSTEWLKKFSAAIPQIPEVLEAHRMAGDIDYMLRIVVPDIDAYDAVYQRLIKLVEFDDVSSYFAMEEMKSTTEVPVVYL